MSKDMGVSFGMPVRVILNNIAPGDWALAQRALEKFEAYPDSKDMVVSFGVPDATKVLYLRRNKTGVTVWYVDQQEG